MHIDFEVFGQGRQEFVQILFAKPEPNRHKDFQDIFWVGKAVWGMEKDSIRPLHVLQYSLKNNNWSGIVREGKNNIWGK